MGMSEPGLFCASLVDSINFYDLWKLPRGLGITTRFVGTDANGMEIGGVLSGVDFLGIRWIFALGAVYARS